jgi:hypothetical protein
MQPASHRAVTSNGLGLAATFMHSFFIETRHKETAKECFIRIFKAGL